MKFLTTIGYDIYLWSKLIRFTAKNNSISLNHAPKFLLLIFIWMNKRSLQILSRYLVPENCKLWIHYFKPTVFTLTGRRKTCEVQKPTAWQIIHNNVFTVEELTAIYWFWANYYYLFALLLYKTMLLKKDLIRNHHNPLNDFIKNYQVLF